jgi:hypothetical protein
MMNPPHIAPSTLAAGDSRDANGCDESDSNKVAVLIAPQGCGPFPIHPAGTPERREVCVSGVLIGTCAEEAKGWLAGAATSWRRES